MTDKKIYRYTIVELLDTIKNGQSITLVESAKSELEKRNLTEVELKTAEGDFLKYVELKVKRKDKPLTREEWITYFFVPFTPRPRWTKDHFYEAEYKRFEKFGFEKKEKQATEARILGLVFWFVVILAGIALARHFNL